MKVLVTGSSGLIGSEAVAYYDGAGNEVIGVDNNMRAQFFGPQGDMALKTINIQAISNPKGPEERTFFKFA